MPRPKKPSTVSEQSESIILGGGCFWCLEAAYQMVRGVIKATPGYAGGHTTDPSYYEVCRGGTGHAEVVKVEFDPRVVSLSSILDVFWTIHDPTTLNRQSYDVGTAYRSFILCSPEQASAVTKSIDQVKALWPNPITTEVVESGDFYPAETEQIDYFKNHPEQAYCQIIINPKLDKLRKAYAQLLEYE